MPWTLTNPIIFTNVAINDDRIYIGSGAGAKFIPPPVYTGSTFPVYSLSAFSSNVTITQGVTTNTIHDWTLVQPNDVLEYVLNSPPTDLQVGNSIRITYSATDSITGTISSIAGSTLTLTVTNVQVQPAGYSRTNQLYSNASVSSDYTTTKDSDSRTIPANSFVWDITLNYSQEYVLNATGSTVSATLQGVSTLTPNATTTSNTLPPNGFEPVNTQFGFTTGKSIFFPVETQFRVIYNKTAGSNTVRYAKGSDGSFSLNTYAGIVRGYTLSYNVGTISVIV